MPPNRRRQLDEQRDDVWIQNESILRRLYLKDHKTLKDVKKAMESEHGFPTTPLSTYESKLRDLGLRKKMKRKDWHPVYRHYINSGNRHTAVDFNGTRIPWDKVWKEIRRSGARELNDGEIIELPTDVVMRTPSPAIPPSAVTLYRARAVPWHLINEPLDGLSADAIFRRLRLCDTPSNLLRIEILNILEQPPPKSRIESNELIFNRCSLPSSSNEAANNTLFHESTTTVNHGSDHEGLTSDIDRFSNALYQLANSDSFYEVDESFDKSYNEALDVILDLAPKHHVLSSIFKGNSPIIRAATEKMVRISTELGRKDDFRIFIEALRRYHPEWIPQGQYLMYAGRIGCVKTCRALLQVLNRSQYDTSFDRYTDYYTRAVLESTCRGHFECARFLCQHAIKLGINFPFSENTLAGKIFAGLLDVTCYERYCSFWDHHFLDVDSTNPNVLQILDWFLEAGADVDAPTQLGCLECDLYTRQSPNWWIPTILDQSYFENFGLYSHIVAYSIKFRTETTRSGIYSSAKEGINPLLMYLRSRPSHTPIQQTKILGIFLAEVLSKSHTWNVSHEENIKVIHTLLNHNTNLPQFGSSMNVSAMLYYVISTTRRYGIIYPTTDHVIKTLICKGATIVPETIAEAVENEDITLLQLLSSYGLDFNSQGALALCAAIKLNNYDAISWLRNRGVDINATLRSNCKEEDVTILKRVIQYIRVHNAFRFDILDYKVVRWRWEEQICTISYEMLKFLISLNIKLRTSPGDTDMRKLLLLVIESGHISNERTETIIKKVRLLLKTETIPDDPPDPEPYLLEARFLKSPTNISAELDLMELLIDHGFSPKHTGILGALIDSGAPIDAIQRILDCGVDVNAYSGYPCLETPLQRAARARSLDLVQLLIQRGANVNQPGKRFGGVTALQMACCGPGFDMPCVDIDLIKFLIANGADVNAPAAPEGGITAFQAAAADGNFEVALLLLDHGADVNEPPVDKYGSCALDRAVCSEKIDMVQFLLQLGALSEERGESGYKGAIGLAEHNSYLAMADMIRQHALKNGRAGEELYSHYTKWKDFHSFRYDKNEIGSKDQKYWEGLQSL
ncbi:hypothetical protein F4679DRAFT_555594 [Xylaria curta]|nr:hypothetical protein F4679DRAFT_555594 [Xylaria curta]